MKNLKKVLAIALAVILLAPAATQTVYAAETNGTYEAENATFSDPYRAYEADFVTINEVDPTTKIYYGAYAGNASGGLVGSFNVIGNSITWTVEADAAGTADLAFSLANSNNVYEYTTDESTGAFVISKVVHTALDLAGHVKITINGVELDLTGKTMSGLGDVTIISGGYGIFTSCEDVVFTGVALQEGTNSIKIEVVNPGYTTYESVSVDCLKVSNYTADPVDDGNDDEEGTGTDNESGTGNEGTGNEGPTIPNKGDEAILLMSVLFVGLALVVVGFATKRKFV